MPHRLALVEPPQAVRASVLSDVWGAPMNDATRGLPLLYDAMRREMELTRPHDILPAVHRLMLALAGIGTCATACGCCSMHAAIAREALLRFETATGLSVEDAYSAEASRRANLAREEAG